MRSDKHPTNTRQVSDVTKLASDLERVSYYGVGHAMDLTERDIPYLAAIARYISPDPQGRLRVSIALAVRKAVLLIDPPIHVEAAAALLWLDLEQIDYDEDKTRKRKPLNQRHPAVAALLGYKLSSYERHKRWRPLYERIADNLLTLRDRRESPDSEGVTTDDASTPRSETDYGTSWLTFIAEAGADLHYAALASLFVGRLHNECAIRHIEIPRLADWHGAADFLFSSFCRFVWRYTRALEKDYILAAMLTVAGRPGVVELERTVRLVELCGPLVSQDSLRIARTYGAMVAMGYKQWAGITEVNGLTAQKMFDNIWLPWHCVQFLGEPWYFGETKPLPSDRQYPKSICMMAALGERVVSHISGRAELTKPVLTASRRRTRRFIATLYDIEEGDPIQGGPSLRDRVNQFFDEADHMLAPEVHPWYDKNTNFEELSEECTNIRRRWTEEVERLFISGKNTANT